MRRMIAAALLILFFAASAAAQETKFEFKDYPTLRVGILRVDFHARVQNDFRRSDVIKQKDNEDLTEVARRRIGIEGRVGKIADYQVEYDLASREWVDVYVDYRQLKAVQVQAGAFKLPFGLEENTSVTKLDFIYRTRVSSQLAPGRDQGVMAHGKLLNSRLRYEAGLFHHDGDNARPKKITRIAGGTTSAARVVVEPFHKSKSKLADFQIGAAATFSMLPEGRPAVRGRTSLGALFFDSDLWVNGTRQRTGIEGRWRPGPFSFQSEFIRMSDQRRQQAIDGGDLTPLVATGWYASGSYRWRFLEGASRYESLTFGDLSGNPDASTSTRAEVILGNAHHALTFGATFFVNRWIKLQANLMREQVRDVSVAPDTKPLFWSRAIRVQVVL